MTKDSSATSSRTGSQRRSGEQWVGTAGVVLFAAIVAMVNYLAFRHYERVDLTSEGMFTLSDKSLKVLGELDQDVDIYLFMSRLEGNFEQTDELLKRYQAASTHVLVHYVDAERERDEFQLIAQRFGVMAGVAENGEVMADVAAVVALGERNWHISRDDLLGFEFGPMGGESEQDLNIKAEQALTGALVQVTRGTATNVCASTGHGEWTLEEQSERGLSTLRHHMRHDNIEWETFSTLGKKAVPADCDAVLVLGPTRAFAGEEVAMLDQYLRKGGNLLLGLDPVIEHDAVADTGFEAMLAGHGITLQRVLAIETDPERLVGDTLVSFVVTEFNDHEVTRFLQGAGRVYMILARGVAPSGDNDAVTPLLRASERSFGETDISSLGAGQPPKKGAGDLEGPVTLAVATKVLKAAPSEPGVDLQAQPGGRLLVVGDTDFLQGPLLDTPALANLDFASAMIGYTAEREALIAIAPKKVKGGNLALTQEDLMALFFRVTVLMPGAALLLGIGVWLSRRA